MKILEVEGLSKDYKQHFWTPRRRVLDQVSFEVNSGEIFGFLGPNGSGKSTTIKILLEIIFPTQGTARLFGKPVGDKESKRRIGFLPENPYFYDYLTAEQFIRFHGLLAGMDLGLVQSRIPQVLDEVGMRGTNKMYLRSFSKGMLQRIGLAQAIVHDPELVILDEPMTGLDPVGRKEVRDLMLSLKRRGKTVFFSTHILSDVEAICDRVAILNKGKLLQCGTLGDLISVDTRYVDLIYSGCSAASIDYLRTIDPELSLQSNQAYLKVFPISGETPEDFQKRLQKILSESMERGAFLNSMSPKKENLEDIFMKQIGRLESRV